MFDSIQKVKCSKCELRRPAARKEFPVWHEESTAIVKTVPEAKVLLLVEAPVKSKRNERWKIKLNELMKQITFKCDIGYAIECETADHKVPSPFYEVYRSCGTLGQFDLSKYSVIITIGKAIYSISKSDELISWEEFREFMFNPTFFRIQHKGKLIRVYPLPYLDRLAVSGSFAQEKFFAHQKSSIIAYLQGPPDVLPPLNIVRVEEPNQWLREQTASPRSEWALDIETNGLNPFVENPVVKCLTLSADGETGYYLDLDSTDMVLLDEFLATIQNQVWANGKFDVKWLMHARGLKNLRVDNDIILMFHMLSTERTKNGLKTLAFFLGYGGYDNELDTYKKKYKIQDYTQIPDEILSNYATLDAILTMRLYKMALELFQKQPRLYECYREITQVYPVFIEMEMKGVNLDIEYLNKLNTQLSLEEQKLAEEISVALDLPAHHISSTEKLALSLKKLKWPCLRKTEKGFYATGDEELNEWKKQGYELAGKLMEYRKVSKLRTAFVGSTEDGENEGLVKTICADGKIHPGYSVAMADTYRCIAKGQKVSMGDGSWKNIENVQIGDMVITHTGQTRGVTDTFYNGKRKTAILKLKTGQQLELTLEHRVLSDRGWLKVGLLDVGIDQVAIGQYGHFSEIDSITPEDHEIDVYDLEVEEDHSYVCEGIVVHNCKHNAPNIAQLPARGREGDLFKPVISVPGSDWYILNMDIAGFQLRLGAIYSNDVNMIDAFVNLGGDLHSASARAVFTPRESLEFFLDHKKESPFKEYRQKAKCFVAGTKILTDRGPMNIEDFVPEINSGAFTPAVDTPLIVDRFGNRKPIESTYYLEDNDELLEILLENEERIEVTPDHQFPVIREGKEIVVLARDLKEGDCFLQRLTMSLLEIKVVSVARRKKRSKVYCFSEPLNHECLVVGEHGVYASKQSINFACEFGAKPSTVAKSLKAEWSDADLMDYLVLAGLRKPDQPLINPNHSEESFFSAEDQPWIDAATDIIDKFFKNYYGLRKWISQQRLEAIDRLYVDTLDGGRRHLPVLRSYNANDRQEKKERANYLNICLNSPIQSHEATIMYRCMTRVYRQFKERGLQSYMMSMIHDYVGFYVHKSEIEQVYEIVRDAFEDKTTYVVPIEIEMSIGKIWEKGDKINDQNYKKIAEELGDG